MAKALHIVDVFRLLLDGAFIVDKTPLISGKSEYKVLLPAFENQPHKCAGHITERQFHELRSKGIILPSGHQSRDKYGNIYTSLYLNKENIND